MWATTAAQRPLLRTCVPRPIIDIAASSVAHYGPVEVLRPPVGRPTTRPLDQPEGCYEFRYLEATMRRKVTPLMLFVALCVVTQPVSAQLVDLTDNRTAEQKWQRSTYLSTFLTVTAIAYAKSLGQKPEHFALFLGELAGPSWASQTQAAFVRGVYQNYRMYDGLEFEILEESETEIRARMNIPYASYFGESGATEGVTLQEFVQVFTIAYERIADHLGFDMTHEVNGDWIEFTVKTRS